MSHPTFIQQHMEEIFKIISPKYCLIDRATGLFLYTMTYVSNPSFVLEIGRYKGCSTCFLSNALTDLGLGGKLLSVDINHDNIEEGILHFLQSTHLIEMDSRNLLSHPDIIDKKFGIIFVDGDHSYDTVLQDLENTYSLSDDSTLWIIDDWECPDIKKAVTTFVSAHPDIVNRGIYNNKIKLLSRTV